MNKTETTTYVEQRNGGYYIVDSRIAIDSIVYAFQDGASPEQIAQSFPLLTLEQIYGAITFYLAQRNSIDAYLAEQEKVFEQTVPSLESSETRLYQKLMSAKKSVVDK
jgi:uncharacterized protein (DUF433 family)